jgi:hypothetical protein
VNSIRSSEGTSSDGQPLMKFSDTPEDLSRKLFSEDFGDPTLYEMLQWHMRHCEFCSHGMTQSPPQFGVQDTRHCSEYYEIAEEYSEYERVYISQGNP